jgi:hypothetical protein
MGKIALEEHMVLDREDHLDRWRTLVPMIPEQFLQRILPPSPTPRRVGWN